MKVKSAAAVAVRVGAEAVAVPEWVNLKSVNPYGSCGIQGHQLLRKEASRELPSVGPNHSAPASGTSHDSFQGDGQRKRPGATHTESSHSNYLI